MSNQITIGSCFAGIGGFELGLERGIPNSKTVWQIEQNKYYIFDGRFLVKSSISGKLVKCNNNDLVLIDNKNPFFKYGCCINNSIPYLETLEGKTIKPHLYIINQKSTLNIVKNDCFSLYLLNRILV